MKTTVVCGLLGSGKTTFIKNSLQGRQEKTVVLVNDFGAAGIDGEIFSAGGIESIELPSGCVCCTLKFDLITTIKKILSEFSPEHLVIEPSGVASPAGVLEALESAGIHNYNVIGIVDVTEFTELYESGMYGSFFRDQIVLSDVILVNKIDLVDENGIRDAVTLVESINPRAILFRTKNAELTASLSQPFLLPSGERIKVRGEVREQGKNSIFKSQAHFHFETLSFKLNGDTSFAQFSIFFVALAGGEFGTVARAKALVATDNGPYRLDCVYGKMDSVCFEREIEDSRLVVIGEGLDRQAIERGLVGSRQGRTSG